LAGSVCSPCASSQTLVDFPLFSFNALCDAQVRTIASFTSAPPQLAVLTLSNTGTLADCSVTFVITPTSMTGPTTLTVTPGTSQSISVTNLQTITAQCTGGGVNCIYNVVANRLVFCVPCSQGPVCGAARGAERPPVTPLPAAPRNKARVWNVRSLYTKQGSALPKGFHGRAVRPFVTKGS
jgi:hypothetical protein